MRNKFKCPVCENEFYGSCEQHYVHFTTCLDASKQAQERQKTLEQARTALYAAADAYNKKMDELGMNEKASIHIEGWVHT